jgi:hypothetical protein
MSVLNVVHSPSGIGIGGSTISRAASPLQYISDSVIEEKIWHGEYRDWVPSLCPLTLNEDDKPGSARTPTFSRVPNDQHRRDTGVYGDPSGKIWSLYLSQAKKVDQERSESWTSNTDGVLVFVRQTP